MKFKILDRWDNTVKYTAEIDCDADTTHSVKLGLAVCSAHLAGADLSGAHLARANLAGANLAGAYLAGAYLSGADLAGAGLARAYLPGAYLPGANLSGAGLTGAYLRGANLTGADLAGADLTGADLTGADLTGAKYGDNIPITKQPIHVSGLRWSVVILDTHMQIGCEMHSFDDWAEFDDRRIAEMDGRDALKFWRTNKSTLMALCRSHEVVSDTTQDNCRDCGWRYGSGGKSS